MKSITVTTDKQIVSASKNPYIREIIIMAGEYGWISLLGARNIDIRAEGEVTMKSLNLAGCQRLRITGIKLETGPSQSNTARVLDIRKCKYVRLHDITIIGNIATRNWRDVPDAIAIENSSHIHIVGGHLHHIRNVARLHGANEDLVMENVIIHDAVDDEIPGAFTVKDDTPRNPHLPNDDGVIQWRGKSWRVVEGQTLVLLPADDD